MDGKGIKCRSCRARGLLSEFTAICRTVRQGTEYFVREVRSVTTTKLSRGCHGRAYGKKCNQARTICRAIDGGTAGRYSRIEIKYETPI
jgi:hypothetical protein